MSKNEKTADRSACNSGPVIRTPSPEKTDRDRRKRGLTQSLSGNPLTLSLSPAKPGEKGHSAPLRGRKVSFRRGSQSLVSCLMLALFIAAPVPAEAEKNSVGMKLVRIPAGEFEMGMLDEHRLKLKHKFSAYQREIHDYIERPTYPVRISTPIKMGATEVTVGQFRRFVEHTGYVTDAERAGQAWTFRPDSGKELGRFQLTAGHSWRDPGFDQTDGHPVTCVSWNDAVAFCRWLGDREDATYRLPTEAEWEYACRAGTDTPYCSGNDPDGIYAFANVADAALYQRYPQDVLRQRVVAIEPGQGDGFVFTAAVASLQSNAWGLFDMHGNVWEWCADRYSDRTYKERADLARQRGSRADPEPIVDPQGPETAPQHEYGDWRSLRGGSWYVAPLQSRSSVRAFAEASDAFPYIGFRVVKEAAP